MWCCESFERLFEMNQYHQVIDAYRSLFMQSVHTAFTCHLTYKVIILFYIFYMSFLFDILCGFCLKRPRLTLTQVLFVLFMYSWKTSENRENISAACVCEWFCERNGSSRFLLPSESHKSHLQTFCAAVAVTSALTLIKYWLVIESSCELHNAPTSRNRTLPAYFILAFSPIVCALEIKSKCALDRAPGTRSQAAVCAVGWTTSHIRDSQSLVHVNRKFPFFSTDKWMHHSRQDDSLPLLLLITTGQWQCSQMSPLVCGDRLGTLLFKGLWSPRKASVLASR